MIEYLLKKGYTIVDHNYHAKCGGREEIDIIACDGDVLAFVEVKTRSSSRFSAPREAVTPAKQRKLRTTAQLYLAQTGQGECPCRFDVAEVFSSPDGAMTVNYITNAF